MSSPEQLEQELRIYLEKEPNLRREERYNYLKTLINKHLEFNKLEHVVNSYDLHGIISVAKGNYTNFNLPLNISGRPIDSSEVRYLATIEAFISYLTRMHLLKKLVKFDIRG